MTATELKARALEVRNEQQLNTLPDGLVHHLNRAAADGALFCLWGWPLTEAQLRVLDRQGFTVTEGESFGEHHFKISWE